MVNPKINYTMETLAGEIKKLKKTKKKSKEKKILTKPKAKLPSYDPKKIIMKGAGSDKLVREGRTKYFDEKYREEVKWLS